MMDRKVIKKTKDGNFDELEDHPLLPLLNLRANPLYSSFALTEAELQSVCLDGNSFTWLELNDDGTPRKQTLIPREDVRDYVVDNSGNLFWDTTYGKLPDERIKHYKVIPKDGVWGLSPISWHRNTLAIGQSAAYYAQDFYEQGAFPSGVLAIPGLVNKETRARVKENLRSTKPGETLVLDGNTTYTPMQPLPGDVQWLSAIKEMDKRIASIFRVPFYMVSSDAEQPNYNSLEQLALEFKNFSIRPYGKMMEMEETYKMLTSSQIKNGERIAFDYSTLDLTDMKTLGEWMTRMATGGFMTINQIKGKYLQLPGVENGDETLVLGNNMTTLKAAVEGTGPIETTFEKQKVPQNGHKV